MGIEKLTASFPWSRYSKKLISKIENPRNAGTLSPREGLRLVESEEGNVADGNVIHFFWLVDKEDGVIVDAKYQVFGQSALIGAAEAACDILVGKNYDQASRISADLIDKQVRDKTEVSAFPHETAPHLNLVLEAIDSVAKECTDIPLSLGYVAPPAPRDFGEVLEGGYPGWNELSLKQKLSVIEEVINNDIRPYIVLDGGGVEVINLLNEKEVIIAYQGNCTSCFSSVGATLSFIQQVIRAKVHPDLVVIPNM